jgi:hypothetical protein
VISYFYNINTSPQKDYNANNIYKEEVIPPAIAPPINIALLFFHISPRINPLIPPGKMPKTMPRGLQ